MSGATAEECAAIAAALDLWFSPDASAVPTDAARHDDAERPERWRQSGRDYAAYDERRP